MKKIIDILSDVIIIVCIFLSCLNMFVFTDIKTPAWFNPLWAVFVALTVIALVYQLVKVILNARARKQEEAEENEE